MKLQVLGCAGGIGGRERLTTCLRIDEDILLDAGTGLTSLGLDELVKIDHIFITHSHLDHVAGLAPLVDTVQGKRPGPITVYASDEVINALKKSLFNWVLWPDFATIPTSDSPAMRWQPIQYETVIDIGGRLLTAYPVNHTVGSSAYWVRNQQDGFLFTGDMSSSPQLWTGLAQAKQLSKVIVDCSFTNADVELAERSLHFCPQSLIDEVKTLPPSYEFLIYHLKPGQEDLIMKELQTDTSRSYTAVSSGDVYEF